LALTPSGVISEANRAACALLRSDASTLIGQTLFRFVTDAQASALRAHFQGATTSSDSQSTDVSLRIPGMPHPLLVQIVSSLAGRDPPEVVSVIVDITERRRAEMVLAFLDNAEQALGTVHTTAAVVDQIPALAVPLLGDLCVVEFRDIANVIHHAAGHIDPQAATELRRLGCSFFDLPAIATGEGVGRGAIFTLALHALRSHDSTPPSPPDASRVARFATPPRMPSIADPTAHPVRVLLVEDDPDTLAVTSMLLRGTYEVATAETISQALNQLRDHDFDLLISDISLPDGSGLDLMREMRERQKGVRGIALSGFGSQEDVRRARLAGFSVHLTKPVSFPRLETTIREITG
jgi:CheY-like chemotaxis protein